MARSVVNLNRYLEQPPKRKFLLDKFTGLVRKLHRERSAAREKNIKG
jgi:hypothetical protein